MQSPLLSTTYAYDSQQVIYIFDEMRVKVNTQRSRVKKCNTQRLPPIKKLLTDDIISENWRTQGLPIGNYYASLGNKYAYFYAAHCVNENPENCMLPNQAYLTICTLLILLNATVPLHFMKGAVRAQSVILCGSIKVQFESGSCGLECDT